MQTFLDDVHIVADTDAECLLREHLCVQDFKKNFFLWYTHASSYPFVFFVSKNKLTLLPGNTCTPSTPVSGLLCCQFTKHLSGIQFYE